MMAEEGINLPNFLFNSPHVSPAPVIDALRPVEAAKDWPRYLLKAGLAKIHKPHNEHMENLFDRLSLWVPELCVHERDPICKGYIDYFEQRQHVQDRFHGIGKSAMMLSYRDMFCSVLGKEKERPDLLPSARLWKNSTIMDDDDEEDHQQLCKCNLLQYVHLFQKLAHTLKAHMLEQWWKPDSELNLNSTRYSYPSA